MAGHYCTEHETIFFMKGKMKNYAHPVDGGGWCNEPEEGGDEVPEEHVEPQFKADPIKTESIQRQTSLKCATDWCIAAKQAGEKDIKTVTILSIATLFESYLSGGMGNLLDGKKVSDDKQD